MGTHATTKVENNGTTVVNMYRHFDGYYDAHGYELANFLASKRLVNGIGQDTTNIANGMDDLAAQIVAHFKNEAGVGNIYLSSLDKNEQYDYTVYESNGKIRMKVRYEGRVMFDGTPAEFLTAKLSV